MLKVVVYFGVGHTIHFTVPEEQKKIWVAKLKEVIKGLSVLSVGGVEYHFRFGAVAGFSFTEAKAG